MEGMSEEQKEYEAMNLVNLIDRLQRWEIIWNLIFKIFFRKWIEQFVVANCK